MDDMQLDDSIVREFCRPLSLNTTPHGGWGDGQWHGRASAIHVVAPHRLLPPHAFLPAQNYITGECSRVETCAYHAADRLGTVSISTRPREGRFTQHLGRRAGTGKEAAQETPSAQGADGMLCTPMNDSTKVRNVPKSDVQTF